MPASDAPDLPPENLYVLHDRGMTAWHAVFDRLTVESLPAGMRALKITSGSTTVYERVLNKREAEHLARLLTD